MVKGDVVNKYWVLLYSQSTVHLLKFDKILSNIRIFLVSPFVAITIVVTRILITFVMLQVLEECGIIVIL